jgi:uncharacterized protein (DUF2141 family)
MFFTITKRDYEEERDNNLSGGLSVIHDENRDGELATNMLGGLRKDTEFPTMRKAH